FQAVYSIQFRAKNVNLGFGVNLRGRRVFSPHVRETPCSGSPLKVGFGKFQQPSSILTRSAVVSTSRMFVFIETIPTTGFFRFVR
ncbi:MAG TPA: hypothetical protein DEB39_01850, partial [Planctomycetaceae bacterium]|nr:hypothetical protein [Planctomycetaceae bacterium]